MAVYNGLGWQASQFFILAVLSTRYSNFLHDLVDFRFLSNQLAFSLWHTCLLCIAGVPHFVHACFYSSLVGDTENDVVFSFVSYWYHVSFFIHLLKVIFPKYVGVLLFLQILASFLIFANHCKFS